jgi:hypothetical protein
MASDGSRMALEKTKWQRTSRDRMPSSRVRRRYVKNVVQRVACGAGKNEMAADESRETRIKTKWRLRNREFMPTGRVGADMNAMPLDESRVALI